MSKKSATKAAKKAIPAKKAAPAPKPAAKPSDHAIDALIGALKSHSTALKAHAKALDAHSARLAAAAGDDTDSIVDECLNNNGGAGLDDDTPFGNVVDRVGLERCLNVNLNLTGADAYNRTIDPGWTRRGLKRDANNRR